MFGFLSVFGDGLELSDYDANRYGDNWKVYHHFDTAIKFEFEHDLTFNTLYSLKWVHVDENKFTPAMIAIYKMIFKRKIRKLSNELGDTERLQWIKTINQNTGTNERRFIFTPVEGRQLINILLKDVESIDI